MIRIGMLNVFVLFRESYFVIFVGIKNAVKFTIPKIISVAGKRLIVFSRHSALFKSLVDLYDVFIGGHFVNRKIGIHLSARLNIRGLVGFFRNGNKGRYKHRGKDCHNRYNYDQFYDSKAFFVRFSHRFLLLSNVFSVHRLDYSVNR